MKDYIVRATAAEGQIRAFAITSRELVETARQDHNTSPVATAALGRLLSAGAMMGVMMKGEKDVLTLQIRCNGPIGGLTVTCLLYTSDAASQCQRKTGCGRSIGSWIFKCHQRPWAQRTLCGPDRTENR